MVSPPLVGTLVCKICVYSPVCLSISRPNVVKINVRKCQNCCSLDDGAAGEFIEAGAQLQLEGGCDCDWTIFTDAGVSTHSITFRLDTEVEIIFIM